MPTGELDDAQSCAAIKISIFAEIPPLLLTIEFGKQNCSMLIAVSAEEAMAAREFRN